MKFGIKPVYQILDTLDSWCVIFSLPFLQFYHISSFYLLLGSVLRCPCCHYFSTVSSFFTIVFPFILFWNYSLISILSSLNILIFGVIGILKCPATSQWLLSELALYIILISLKNTDFQVFIASIGHIILVWVLTLCLIVGRHTCFSGLFCHHLRGCGIMSR